MTSTVNYDAQKIDHHILACGIAKSYINNYMYYEFDGHLEFRNRAINIGKRTLECIRQV
jgi:hypothetical protein